MDALTNFELEAQRRRETMARDRDRAWARANVAMDAADAGIVEPRVARQMVATDRDPQPASLARSAAG